ncbi:hypothetical protein D3C87_2199490 [compost metagenome]
MEVLAVPVDAVALVPFHEHVHGIAYTHPVVFGIAQNVQGRFHHGAEQNPVAAAGCGAPGFF